MAKNRYKPCDKFNYWTLKEYVKDKKQWIAQCVCGKEKLVWVDHLKNGKSISCSCIGKSTHKMTGTPTYVSWNNAKQRCTNKNNQRFYSYGGRGIEMCDRWLNSFDNFFEDMGERPVGMSIDRIDVDGNYEPGNCRWATDKEQSNNLRIHKERGFSLEEISKLCDIPREVLGRRISNGWDVEKATQTEYNEYGERRKHQLEDKFYSIIELSNMFNIPYGRLQTRLNRGWELGRALTEPLSQGKKKINDGQNTKLKKTNKSGISGVFQKKTNGKWIAQITVNKQKMTIGTFNTIEDASIALENKRMEIKNNLDNYSKCG